MEGAETAPKSIINLINRQCSIRTTLEVLESIVNIVAAFLFLGLYDLWSYTFLVGDLKIIDAVCPRFSFLTLIPNNSLSLLFNLIRMIVGLKLRLLSRVEFYNF